MELEELIIKSIGDIRNLRVESNNIIVNGKFKITLLKLDDKEKITKLYTVKGSAKCAIHIPSESLICKLLDDEYVDFSLVNRVYTLMNRYGDEDTITSEVGQKVISKIISIYDNEIDYDLVDLLISGHNCVRNVICRQTKHFSSSGYNQMMRSVANIAFSSDPIIRQLLLTVDYPTMPEAYITDISILGHRLFTCYSMAFTFEDLIKIIFTINMNRNRDKCLNYPMIYKICYPVIHELEYDEVIRCVVVIEQFIHVKISDLTKEELGPVLEQVRLAVLIAIDVCGYFPDINHDNIICRILKKESNIRYIVNGETKWVRSRYLPVILTLKLSNSESVYTTEDIDTIISSLSGSTRLSTKKKPKKGIFWNDIRKPKFPTTVSTDQKVIQLLYKYYLERDKRIIEQINYDEVKILLAKKSSKDKKSAIRSLVKISKS